jgi:hypothetical protein
MHRFSLGLVILATVIVIATPPAYAHDPESSDWEMTAAPFFLWVVGIEGDAQVGPLQVEIDYSFSDVLDDLKFMYDVHFEGRHKSGWGYGIEPMFIFLESDAQIPAGTIQTDTDFIIFEAMGFRRLGGPDSGLDLLFGGRYWSISAKINTGLGVSVEDEVDWGDGFAGLRWQRRLGKKWNLSLRGDVGAGGSDLTWRANALAIVDLTPRLNLGLGYQHMDVDYEGDGSIPFVLDFFLSGPIFGLEIKF